MAEVQEKKKAWRRTLGDLFHLISRDERRRFDAQLSRRVGEHIAAAKAERILGFASMVDEVDLSVFYRAWLKNGGKLALPIWLGGDRMTIREITDLDNQLQPGRGGILEPVDTLPEIGADSLDMVICPGRAFSESLARMGRGSGCYDTLIRQYGMANFGVAYDFQVFPAIPTYSGDMRLDAIVTPSRTLYGTK